MALSRSEQMSRIRGRGTRPEEALGALLLGSPEVAVEPQGRTPVGRADFVLRSCETVAVFVDGCFWHGCPDHYTRPGTRPELWAKKLRDTVDRDRRQTAALLAAGWRVLRRWEHEVAVNRTQIADEAIRLASGGQLDATPSWRVVAVEEVDPVARTERAFLLDLTDTNLTAERVARRHTTKWRSGAPAAIVPSSDPCQARCR